DLSDALDTFVLPGPRLRATSLRNRSLVIDAACRAFSSERSIAARLAGMNEGSLEWDSCQGHAHSYRRLGAISMSYEGRGLRRAVGGLVAGHDSIDRLVVGPDPWLIDLPSIRTAARAPFVAFQSLSLCRRREPHPTSGRLLVPHTGVVVPDDRRGASREIYDQHERRDPADQRRQSARLRPSRRSSRR